MTSIESLETSFREWWAAQGYAAKPNPHTVTVATAWASTLLPPEPVAADGPAVPEGREPASVAEQPKSPPDWRGLCEKLLRGLDENRHPEVRYPGDLRLVMASAREALAQPEPERGMILAGYIHRQGNHWELSERPLLDDEIGRGWTQEPVYRAALAQPEPEVAGPADEELLELARAELNNSPNWEEPEYDASNPFPYEAPGVAWLNFARAVLARWGHQPAPPAEGEVGELVTELRMMASQAAEACQFTDAESLSSVADLLEQRHPAPVPVSERLPEPEDCLDEGWAWFFSPRVGWRQAVLPVSAAYTHWLPAHALPLPQGEVE